MGNSGSEGQVASHLVEERAGSIPIITPTPSKKLRRCHHYTIMARHRYIRQCLPGPVCGDVPQVCDNYQCRNRSS